MQAAIAAGDETTGVTIMQMEEGLDSGPIVLQREIPIGPDETCPQLSARLAHLGGELLIEALAGLEAGTLVPRPQEEWRATHAPRLSRQDGRVDWEEPARRLYARLRAFTPWPGLHAELAGEPVKIVAARPGAAGDGLLQPGTIERLDDAILVRCGAGTALELTELQRPGRRPLAAADFARGERLEPGDRFG